MVDEPRGVHGADLAQGSNRYEATGGDEEGGYYRWGAELLRRGAPRTPRATHVGQFVNRYVAIARFPWKWTHGCDVAAKVGKQIRHHGGTWDGVLIEEQDCPRAAILLLAPG